MSAIVCRVVADIDVHIITISRRVSASGAWDCRYLWCRSLSTNRHDVIVVLIYTILGISYIQARQ